MIDAKPIDTLDDIDIQTLDESVPEWRNGYPFAWLILRYNRHNEVSKEVIVGPLTDDHHLFDGDVAYPLCVDLRAVNNPEVE